MTLNPWRLRLLADLAACGTVRAVAQRGNLSPSAVSQQLATLERETRTALLERTGRRVRLTAAGVLLAGRAREILAAMDAAEAELRGLADEPAGTVTLAAFQSAVHALAEPAVARLGERHPDVTVVLLDLEPHDSMPALRRGDVDVIITTTDFVGAELDPAIDLVPIAEDEIVLVLPAGHPLGSRKALSLAEATQIPGLPMPRWPYRDGGYPEGPGPAVHDHTQLLQLIALGRAVAVLPESSRAHLGSGLTTVPVPDAPPVTTVIAWPPQTRSRAVAGLVRAATRI